MSQPPDPRSPGDGGDPYGYGRQGQYPYSAYSEPVYQQGYPPGGYQQQPPPPPPKKKWPWVVGGVAAVIVLGLAVATGVVLGAGGDNRTNDAAFASPTTASRAGAQAVAPRSAAANTSDAAPTASPAPSGLPSNGILKVGTDIHPGEYAVSAAGASSGYWERLSCLSGDFECIIANDIVTGKGYLTVLPGDVAVKVQDLRLVATGAAPQAPVHGSGGGTASGAGTDSQGFVGRPAARCNADNDAVVIARTDASLVVVCETGVGRYYYKGVRLEDGAAIEIDDPVRTGSGFTATNNGVQYSLDSTALEITDGSKELASEPMLQYWPD